MSTPPKQTAELSQCYRCKKNYLGPSSFCGQKCVHAHWKMQQRMCLTCKKVQKRGGSSFCSPNCEENFKDLCINCIGSQKTPNSDFCSDSCKEAYEVSLLDAAEYYAQEEDD